MFGEIIGPLLFKPQHMKNLVNSLTVIVPISNMPNSVSSVPIYIDDIDMHIAKVMFTFTNRATTIDKYMSPSFEKGLRVICERQRTN